MKKTIALSLVLVACSATDNKVTPKPDNTSSSSSSGTGGQGGSSSSGDAGTGGDSTVAGFVSGSRLRARYYEGTDGSKQMIGWHDSELGMGCTVLPAEDGSLRCLPSMVVTTYFADQACAQPAAAVTKGCPVFPMVSGVVTAETCTSGAYRGYVVGIAASTVYAGEPGNCTEQTGASTTWDLYTLGLMVPSQFVEMTEHVE